MKAFEKTHPFVLMCYFLLVLIMSMFIANPVIHILSLVGGIAFCSTFTTLKEKLSDVGFYVALAILITITNPIFSHNGETPLFFMNGNPITLEAFLYGGDMAVMLVAVMLWCKSCNRVMTSDKFVFLFGRIMPKLSIVMSIALRLIPLIKRQSHKINRSQKAMGIYSSESYTDRLLSAMGNMSVLTGWSMENAINTSNSMKARGYGLKGHTSYNQYRFKLKDISILCIIAVVVGFVIYGSVAGYTSFSFYPYITEINATTTALAIYFAFGILVLIPFFVEMEENIRWIYYRSRI